MGKDTGRVELHQSSKLQKGYGGHKAAKPAKETMTNEKMSFTCLFLKMQLIERDFLWTHESVGSELHLALYFFIKTRQYPGAALNACVTNKR